VCLGGFGGLFCRRFHRLLAVLIRSFCRVFCGDFVVLQTSTETSLSPGDFVVLQASVFVCVAGARFVGVSVSVASRSPSPLRSAPAPSCHPPSPRFSRRVSLPLPTTRRLSSPWPSPPRSPSAPTTTSARPAGSSLPLSVSSCAVCVARATLCAADATGKGPSLPCSGAVVPSGAISFLTRPLLLDSEPGRCLALSQRRRAGQAVFSFRPALPVCARQAMR